MGPRDDDEGGTQRAARRSEELLAVLAGLPGPVESAAAAVALRERQLTKPQGALGRLEQLTAWLALWQGESPPALARVRVCVFAANHGIAARGVSAYPAAVTAEMVRNYRAGGAAINQICREIGAELVVEALSLDRPTRDFTESPAMDADECWAAFEVGMATVEPDLDLLCLGEMGIGNTTVAAALSHALFGGSAADWTGPGTGVAGERLAAKAALVELAVARHRGEVASLANDPFELLRRLGGRELAAIAGAAVAARRARVPVLLDGYASTAAAAALWRAEPKALDHCLVAHVSAEPGHRHLVERLGMRALLDLDMRLGEATGAALAVALLRAALACHTGMATFAEAGVSGKIA